MPLNSNVTLIENLPELSDIENSFGKGGGEIEDFSGMGRGNRAPGVEKYIRKVSRENYQNTPYDRAQYVVEQPQPKYDYTSEGFDPSPSPSSSQFTCLDVCNHIKGCPLCSKFYNNDNSLYIIIIIALLILVIILTKKVLNV